MHYVMPFILGMVVTMVWLPVLAKLAHRWLFVDQPGVRKVHATPIPRVGGIAMAVGVFVAALLTIDLQPADRWFLAAALVLIAFGILDDRFDLDYRLKFAGQLIAVNLVVLMGDVRIQTIALNDRLLLPEWISLPLTVLFLVGVTNAVNLADGLDGLAGGTTFFCLCAVALLSSVGVSGTSTALALAFAGAVLGFLRFNTYPASVFMGDAGSQLLGFSIGVLSIRATQNAASEISAAIPILLLALPILDTLSVMVQRVAEGRSPFSADKNHIHHKLLALGFRHHEAVTVIYAVQGLLFVAAYALRYESDLLILGIVATFFAVAIGALQWASHAGWRFRSERGTATPRSAATAGLGRALERVANVILGGALVAYAATVVLKTATLSRDFQVLLGSLLAVTIAFALVQRNAPLGVVEKAALYVTATSLIWLDTVVFPVRGPLAVVGWLTVALAAVATVVRLRLSNDRRFQLTPLDLIVLFMALVVPSLPGTWRLSEGSALAIAKLVVLFYAIEMLVTRAEGRAIVLRVASASILGGLFARALLT